MLHGTLISSAPQSFKLCPTVGTVDGLACFLLTNFITRRHHNVSKIYDGRLDRVRIACVRRVRAISDSNHRSRQHGAAAASDSSFQGNWRASKLVGLSVYNDNNESLGSINDLLMDKDGNIKGVVLGVGGFLGVGEHLVAIPFDKMKFVNEPVAYTGAAGGPNANAPGTRPAPSTTTGAATTSTNTAPATAAASRSNPWYPDHAVFSATKDQLKAMPEFKYAT